MWMELTKLRLNVLVLLTAAVGYVLGRHGLPSFDWAQFGLTLLGTGLAAASAAILNQTWEAVRDARMHRTRDRPVASGRLSRSVAFIAGMAAGYAGVATLLYVGGLPALLALLNIGVYVLVYTPLKPVTTLNTLLGAVCGAIPPMIGWSAATGGLEPGAWVVGALLFVWQLPHFFALAWMYREDYHRGGHMMLPVLDRDGRLTGQVMTTSATLLVPVALLATLFGIAGWWSAAVSVVVGLWFSIRCLRFWRSPSDELARRTFLASLIYLPIVLGVMVLDRGAITPEAAIRGMSDPVTAPSSPVPSLPAPPVEGSP